MDAALERLGRLVRQRRKALDLTQREAAARGRMSDVTWTKIEAGRKVSDRYLARAERALEWPPDTIESILTGRGPSWEDDLRVALAGLDLSDDERDQVIASVRELRRQRRAS